MILVSFCNSKSRDNLAVLNDDLTEVRFVTIGGSITGIAEKDGKIFLARNGVEILQLNTKLELENTYGSGLQDIHSMAFNGNQLFVVNTSDDSIEVIEYKNGFLQGAPKEVLKAGRGGDSIHLNSICFFEGELLFSGFGESELSKAESQNGNIQSKESLKIQGLKHPHSLLAVGGDVYFLESKLSKLYKNFEPITQLDGYTRGLAKLGDKLLIGVSQSRNGEESGLGAKILLINEEGGLYDLIEFEDKKEIYDILVV
jgi:hypothetical protein